MALFRKSRNLHYDLLTGACDNLHAASFLTNIFNIMDSAKLYGPSDRIAYITAHTGHWVLFYSRSHLKLEAFYVYKPENYP